MLEITNRTKSPIQILVKSKQGAYIRKTESLVDTNRAFKSINIPGIGSGKNQIVIEDEKITEYIKRLEKDKLIYVRKVPS